MESNFYSFRDMLEEGTKEKQLVQQGLTMVPHRLMPASVIEKDTTSTSTNTTKDRISRAYSSDPVFHDSPLHLKLHNLIQQFVTDNDVNSQRGIGLLPYEHTILHGINQGLQRDEIVKRIKDNKLTNANVDDELSFRKVVGRAKDKLLKYQELKGIPIENRLFMGPMIRTTVGGNNPGQNMGNTKRLSTRKKMGINEGIFNTTEESYYELLMSKYREHRQITNPFLRNPSSTKTRDGFSFEHDSPQRIMTKKEMGHHYAGVAYAIQRSLYDDTSSHSNRQTRPHIQEFYNENPEAVKRAQIRLAGHRVQGDPEQHLRNVKIFSDAFNKKLLADDPNQTPVNLDFIKSENVVRNVLNKLLTETIFKFPYGMSPGEAHEEATKFAKQYDISIEDAFHFYVGKNVSDHPENGIPDKHPENEKYRLSYIHATDTSVWGIYRNPNAKEDEPHMISKEFYRRDTNG